MTVYAHLQPFMRLFSGLDRAYGTGQGRWVPVPPTAIDYFTHLQGKGPGIGIGPLRPDNTVTFAAIDLDEPDFEAARQMQRYIPGTSWIERSRSGNAHIWVFFSEPIPAWCPMGILKMATGAAGKEHVEVFPKNHDFSMVKFGNYINLPYHGESRPILKDLSSSEPGEPQGSVPMDLWEFLDAAEATRNDPQKWLDKARWLQITEPKPRNDSNFGEQDHLHICAKHIIESDVVIGDGNRNGVFFMLSKCLSNWSMVDHDEVVDLLMEVNSRTEPPLPESEVERILANAERGRYTSTGCDDPLVAPYTHPDCRIANPRR